MKATQVLRKGWGRIGLRRLGALLLMAQLILSTGSCGFLDRIPGTISEAVDKVATAINDAINRGENVGDAIDDVLKSYPDEIRSIIEKQIKPLVSGLVADLGSQLTCSIEELREMLGDAVKGAGEGLDPNQGGMAAPAPSAMPVVCIVSPDSVLFEDAASGNQLPVQLLGRNFPEGMRARLHNKAGAELLDVSESLIRISPFRTKLNIDFQLPDDAYRIDISWKEQAVASVSVLHAGDTACKTLLDSVVPSAISYVPQLQAGDAEFDGGGPHVQVQVDLFIKAGALYARTWIRMRETEDDWSTAEGSWVDLLHKPDPGWQTTRIIGATRSTLDYTDGDHDAQTFEPAGPVARMTVYGDNKGDDIGIYSRVAMTWEAIHFEIQQTTGCQ